MNLLKSRTAAFGLLVVFLVLSLVGYFTFGPGYRLVRAAALLQRIADGHGDGRLADFDRHAVDEIDSSISGAGGTVPVRLYVPRGVNNPPAMVIAHGVHHLGIHEPRLMAFSRAISAAGILVLTPELQDIADYHVSEQSIQTIGDAAQALSQRVGGHKVGVLGLSFAGGLSIMAAADPRFADAIGFVVSIGGHDDLARVCDFFATDRISGPDGRVIDLKAHEYGALVYVYSHPEDFFPAQDVVAAREAIRFQLWEETDRSRLASAKLSPAGRAKMDLLLAHKEDGIATELEDSVRKHVPEMGRVSPHGHLKGLRVPVLLLHGAGDTVIPASEMAWLAHDVPKPWLRAALVTPLLTHVDVGEASARDKFQLVEFIAEMLHQADNCAQSATSATSAEAVRK